jgi:transposase
MSMERPFSESDWIATPERRYVEALEQRIEKLETSDTQVHQRIDQLESRLNQNSQNSSKPPSSDLPYHRPERVRRKSKRRRGGQKGHKGYRQQLLKPTETMTVEPGPCACGCTR